MKQFTYNPSAMLKGLVSCVGNDYCNLALIETKSRAVQTVRRSNEACRHPQADYDALVRLSRGLRQSSRG